MAEPKHIDVVRHAYELWQKAGEPKGRDEEFYVQAQAELRNDDELSPDTDVLSHG